MPRTYMGVQVDRPKVVGQASATLLAHFPGQSSQAQLLVAHGQARGAALPGLLLHEVQARGPQGGVQTDQNSGVSKACFIDVKDMRSNIAVRVEPGDMKDGAVGRVLPLAAGSRLRIGLASSARLRSNSSASPRPAPPAENAYPFQSQTHFRALILDLRSIDRSIPANLKPWGRSKL